MASGRAIEAARAFVSIGGDDSKLRKTLGAIKGQLGTALKGAAVAGAAGLAAFTAGAVAGTAAVFKFASVGDQLEKMSARTGVSADSLSQLGFAAEQSGASLEQLGSTLFRMQRRVANFTTGGGPAKRALDELGFAAADFDGVGTEDAFFRIVEALQAVEDPALRAQYAFEVLGDDAKALMPLVNAGADGIRELMNEADELGLTVTQGQAASAAKFADAWNRIKRVAGAVVVQVGARLAPLLTSVADSVLPALVTAGEMVVVAVEAMGEAFGRAAELAGGAIDYLVERFPQLSEIVSGTFGGIVDALTSGEYALAAKVLWLGLKNAWLTGIQGLQKSWIEWSSGFRAVFSNAIDYVARKWSKLQNILSKAIVSTLEFFGADVNAEEVNAELDRDLQRRLQARDREADAAAQQRQRQLDTDLQTVQTDLEQARAEWAAAIQQANDAAENAANEPNAAEVAGGKFSELIASLRAGDIATRVETAAKAPAAVGDLRTAGGAGVLYRVLNSQGEVGRRQLAALQMAVQHSARTAAAVEDLARPVNV